MDSLFLDWAAFGPPLLVSALAIGTAVSMHERHPRAAMLVAVGISVRALAPLALAGLPLVYLPHPATAAAAVILHLVVLAGTASALAAALVDRPSRNAREEV